ncbi:Protein CBG20072 [Caenorhabditis briggsae]|uniref:Protein CBG20072 n=1 Tax=Caenorhabditis briggsae TaxID=6238 RepID=A8XX11_CAEBR|nr:Protein CBG20072 [Caenorhabditis briggsae]CAP37180.2 Protein CBG20072 [Caenorhabditis briggsae]
MSTMTPLTYQSFNGTFFDDVNSYISGIISLVFNSLLIYAISKIKTYTKSVRFSMYSMALLRLAFSITIVLTCPAIIYSKNIKSLYIIKNGYNSPTPLGNTFLSFFVAFIVMSCNGPAVQYLQVANLLSKSSHKELSKTISIMPIVVVITSLILIFFGYIPPFYEIHISSFLLEKLAEQGNTAFLIITVQLTFDSTDENYPFQLFSQICTLFILIIMFISILIVGICYFYIRKQMKIRFSISSVSTKSQEQLNMALLLQFILPFITIHIPFYIIVILPFFGIAGRILADRFLYLFCWCPAINPILVIVMVKNIQDQLVPRKMSKKSTTTNTKISGVTSKSKSVRVFHLE